MPIIIQLNFIKWLQVHLIPCPFKAITGMDCPGCGFQRSVIALIQGDIHGSLALYPAAIPILAAFFLQLMPRKFSNSTNFRAIRKALYIFCAVLVSTAYCVKLYHLYKASV